MAVSPDRASASPIELLGSSTLSRTPLGHTPAPRVKANTLLLVLTNAVLPESASAIPNCCSDGPVGDSSGCCLPQPRGSVRCAPTGSPTLLQAKTNPAV